MTLDTAAISIQHNEHFQLSFCTVWRASRHQPELPSPLRNACLERNEYGRQID